MNPKGRPFFLATIGCALAVSACDAGERITSNAATPNEVEDAKDDRDECPRADRTPCR